MTATYSLTTYRVLLGEALAAGYTVLPFDDPGARTAGLRLFLRHDVDYSLDMAHEAARVNAALGVSASFFVLLRSQVYNALSSWSRQVIADIHGLGQRIALHAAVDAHLEGRALERAVRRDFEVLKADVGHLSPVFSWHNPTAERLARTAAERVGGLLNVYAPRFTREAMYISDSNLRHSPDDLLHTVRDVRPPALHLLLHPLNWVAGGRTMADVLAGTWKYVIREREAEIRQNRGYADALPDGMPETVLDDFVESWRRACDAPPAVAIGATPAARGDEREKSDV